jgi:hypothetical protein
MLRTVSYLALACLIGSTMPAYCQTAPANDKIKIDVTRAELQIIGQGLMELPYKTVAPVLNDLQAQLNAADAAVKAAAEPKPEAKPADAPAEPAK